jgi:hypothetical protein
LSKIETIVVGSTEKIEQHNGGDGWIVVGVAMAMAMAMAMMKCRRCCFLPVSFSYPLPFMNP